MAKVCCGESLWGDKEKYLQFYKGDLVAINGSTIEDTLTLSDLRFNYDLLNHFRLVLKPNQSNFKIPSEGATFLAIVVRYDKLSVNAEDNYINYYYENDPSNLYPIGNLIILTGNISNTLENLYLSNPSENYDVTLDIMIGSLNGDTSYYPDFDDSGTKFNNLLFTQLGTNVVNESVVLWDTSTPRKKLVVFNIISVNIQRNGTLIVIDQPMVPKLYLTFEDEENAKQAQSLLNYVMNNQNIVIDTLSPREDNLEPVVYFKSNISNNTLSGDPIVLYINNIPSTDPSPYNTSQGSDFRTTISLSDFGVSSSLSKQSILNLSINSVLDNRDGNMIITEDDIILYDSDDNEINIIGAIGTYTIKFILSDIAGNIMSNDITYTIEIVL